jgi:biotin operon repressor
MRQDNQRTRVCTVLVRTVLLGKLVGRLAQWERFAMIPHGRRYGDRESHPIYIWNGVLEPKHLKRIGPALPLFLWLIDRTTKEHEGVGDVLGGKPVPGEEIAESMGVDERTIRRWMDLLERQGYIGRTLTPRGYNVRVMKSCKFPKRTAVVGQDCPTTEGSGRTEMPGVVGQECPPTPDKSVRPNKSKQLSKQKEEAAGRPAGGSELWNLIGVSPEKMPGEFRELCEHLFASKNGQPLAEFVGVCMDGWQALGGKKQPREFVQAANRIREEAKNPAPAPIKFLPEMPFQPKKVGQCQS